MVTVAERARDDSVGKWLHDHPNVRRRAIAALKLDEERLPEIVLDEPGRLADLYEAILEEGKKEGPPSLVAEELRSRVGKAKSGKEALRRYQYTIGKLKELKDSRDEQAFIQGIERALRTAPDEANKKKLEDMLEVLQEQAREAATEQPAIRLSPYCPGCCVLGCVVCTGWCLACCAVGCLLC